MKWAEWAMIVLVLWTVLGIAGVVLALYRGERVRVRRGVSALLVVWAVYLSVLLVVSRAQPSRVLSPGQDRCFDEMCFAVLGAEAMEGFRTRGSEPERLLRVTVHVSNHGKRQTESEAALRAYLLDTRGHRWSALPGLSGVPLTVPVPPGGSTLSSPVYRLPRDGEPVGLIFSHGLSPSRLVIGDPESFGHQPDIFMLQTAHPVAALARPPRVAPLGPGPPLGARP